MQLQPLDHQLMEAPLLLSVPPGGGVGVGVAVWGADSSNKSESLMRQTGRYMARMQTGGWVKRQETRE
jgi:hypothetical protein